MEDVSVTALSSSPSSLIERRKLAHNNFEVEVMSADPLSFLAGEDSSSSESDGEAGEEGTDNLDGLSSETTAPNPNKLPSPDSLFATVKRPSFLADPSKRDVDWDNFVKNDTDDQPNPHLAEGDGDYAAIAPPKDPNMHNKKVHSSLSAAIIRTYSNTGGEISAPPIRYSTDDVDPKFRTVSNSAEGGVAQVGVKRANVEDEGGEEEGTKKSKTENFRQKEKRKRNLGQTSRGKSYVEEEKRVLRQQFAMDEIMN